MPGGAGVNEAGRPLRAGRQKPLVQVSITCDSQRLLEAQRLLHEGSKALFAIIEVFLVGVLVIHARL